MEVIKKSSIELSDTLIPDLFILNYMSSLDGNDLKVYLYLSFLSKNMINVDKKGMQKKLQITEQALSFCIDKLETEGLITKTNEGYYLNDIKEVEINKSYNPKIETKITSSQTEAEKRKIAAACAINESFFQGVMSSGWSTDIGTMFEKYMFSEEVMIALFHYCQERKALNKKYVHAVGENWYKGGVKTFEQLEDYLESFEKTQKIRQRIQKALRLNRNFTEYEEQYIDKWIKEYKYDFDVIEEALKRTTAKANPSINYVNGILLNWFNKGYKTLDEVKNEPSNRDAGVLKEQKPKQKLDYQNYEQRNYDDLETYYDNV